MISWCLYLCLLDVVCLWLFMFVLVFIGLFALFWLFALVVWCLIGLGFVGLSCFGLLCCCLCACWLCGWFWYWFVCGLVTCCCLVVVWCACCCVCYLRGFICVDELLVVV